MKLWHVTVGFGRFIVRAERKPKAIELARKAAEDYYPTAEDAQRAEASADLLRLEGRAEVLDIDFS